MPISRVLEPEVMDSREDAEDYDRMDHSQVNRVFVDDLLSAIKAATSGRGSSPASSTEPLAPSLDILDLGTGTALIPIELCRRWAGCRITAVDAATSMLDLARENIAAAGFTDRIEVAQIDAKRLPYPDGQFDVVMSNSILHHIPEPLGVLREAVRVARPGGLLFFRDLLRPDSTNQLDSLVATYAADCNPHQRQLFADSLHAALSLAEIRDLIALLGFAADSAQQTSDRHWTWSASRS
jgi:ubiquinone/menaquinone biosynthesis C-methylase UbiE